MIISTERWRALAVWCGLFGLALAGKPGDGQSSSKHEHHSMIRQSDGDTQELFTTTWSGLESVLTLGKNYTIGFTVNSGDAIDAENRTVVLCYTQKIEGGVLSSNTWNVVDSIPYVLQCPTSPCQFSQGAKGTLNLGLNVTDNMDITPYEKNSNNAFFLCVTLVDYIKLGKSTTVVCGSYSPFFNVKASNASPLNLAKRQGGPEISSLIPSVIPTSIQSLFAASTAAAASDIISITTTTQIFSVLGVSTSAVSAPLGSSTTINGATVTTSPTAPPTSTGGTDAADATGTTASTSHPSGLSLGAKVGIALGAIILVFLLLLALLLLLRRRRKNPPQNPSHTPQPLLSSALQNNDSHSHSLFVAEKLALNDRTDTNTPLTSRGANMGISASSSYDLDRDDDLPAPGSAFTANTPVPISPRRSLAANTLRSEAVSRAVSLASAVSRPVSPSAGDNSGGVPISRETSRERIGERSIFDQEPYTDNIGVATSASGGNTGSGTGTSRNTNLDVPKVYKGTLQAPFLSEPGMSAEEISRLEEEERRIDEAIAEAEEERRRAREASGR